VHYHRNRDIKFVQLSGDGVNKVSDIRVDYLHGGVAGRTNDGNLRFSSGSHGKLKVRLDHSGSAFVSQCTLIINADVSKIGLRQLIGGFYRAIRGRRCPQWIIRWHYATFCGKHFLSAAPLPPPITLALGPWWQQG
jgi:hypothetical protein